MKALATSPLDKHLESRLFEFMNRDRIRHFYALYDLEHHKAKTMAWTALSNDNDNIVGYLVEYDKRILFMRGNEKSAVPLLKNSDLTSAVFNIEPHHLSAIKRLHEPTEPADKMTKGLITTFKTMKTTPKGFKPIVKHPVQELNQKNVTELANLLGTEPQTALGFFTGLALGAFQGGKLVSFAASPEMLNDLAIIRGVQTVPTERGKGYATSVCSALVQRLVQEGRDVMLYVSKDNPAAIKVYRKIGFRETGHLFLGFAAKRKTALLKKR